MEFFFGEGGGSHRQCIEAKNLDQAIKVYKVKVLFPEENVYSKHSKEHDYNADLDRNEYKWKVKDPKIPIYVFEEKKRNWNLVGELSLWEAINVDYQKLIPAQTTNLLAAPEIEESDEKALVPQAQLPVIGDADKVSLYTKLQMREKHDELKVKEAELKDMMRNMNKSLGVLKKELDKKIKAVYMLETFLGVNEQIVQLLEGKDAPEDTPLTLFQQKLYMDEEIGIWSDGGLDFKDLDTWDKWISKHYDRFLYDPKSICAFQIRRTEKNYAEDRLVNAFMNEPNFMTYFLIRNGSNLYRIWSNVHISDRLFPAETEYADMMTKKEDFGHSEKYAKEAVKNRHLQYLYGVIAIQGLVERTPILGATIKTKLNLMSLNKDMMKYVKFVRDDETNHWVTSGKPSWYGFLKKNQDSIHVGTRVTVIPGRLNYPKKEDAWRTAPYRCEWPAKNYLYTIEEEASKEEKTSAWSHGWSYVIRYNPCDTIWKSYDSHERKRRVPFRFCNDEIINFDDITIEDCEYYRTNRNERKDYLDILPALHWIMKIKKEEADLDVEFTKYLAGQLRWPEKRYPEIQKAIVWWRLKNKWKRALSKDEAKAVRMILRRLQHA